MHGGGHNAGAPRTMQRTKEKLPSQKMLNEALAAEATTLPPVPPESPKEEMVDDYEEHHHTKATMAERRAERAERTADADKQHQRGRDSNSDDDDDDARSDNTARTEFHYTHPKPRVLTGALFMWEHVASFSEPVQVAQVERVSRDVAAHLKESNKGPRLMQRYWNAQWCRMVRKEEDVPVEKRYLPPNMLTRSEGKRRWKKVFVEEYPFFLDRTYQRHGVRNNDVNEAKVLFHVEALNPNRTAAELRKMELTVEEARAKEQRKRGVEVEFEHVEENGAGASGEGGAGAGGCGGVVRPGLDDTRRDHAAREKGRPRAVQKDSYSRADYKEDFRTGARKGKHQKGGTNRWDNFDSYGDYDY
ncbi:hypothetical protein ABB37_02196 [Leptomonas pyrrhocoris]|uniref:Uncharacterized protein n=1 Tax=Leptomonas pyrrhocoris TaxID=157538 RepID=A0A0N0DYG0_LEPPY|nr:hypothetical protein ABB37_02196 [Leptomonas pyrrhocoris]XP_015662533.1 hypothetical protein ABB37_02196 [Leptomonas pyrrhocoris]XP_015662534.1 hypothetical protein ABB37_02196 [Leptomonas pyrrhocoris]KPA84093.1 hypothetical protein ABB37_02196 [Leptomonas pyrrhocoris]KPA84094.1 hypothetical protein ABB37_02196 [Leptomonas pyrrhocoris]KPA84095.1 hypothetical protein ABB37_02196 [Leptomonas pyrrhocoris]|eukprot:XP_015662532.1 hypothetical protein ABB37_02196 [Leptomonas pyrrhocoris]